MPILIEKLTGCVLSMHTVNITLYGWQLVCTKTAYRQNGSQLS